MLKNRKIKEKKHKMKNLMHLMYLYLIKIGDNQTI